MRNKNSKPDGLLEHLDAYTGAPARAAIARLQGDFTDLPGAASAAMSQFGADPKEAPTGQDLAANMGLSGVGKTLAGLGLELAADPTNAITGAAKLATLPFVTFKALKAADAAGDVARAARIMDAAGDASKAVGSTADAGKAMGIIQAPTAAEGIRLAQQAPSEFGRIIQLPDPIEVLKAQRLAKSVEKFPKVRNIIKGRK